MTLNSEFPHLVSDLGAPSLWRPENLMAALMAAGILTFGCGSERAFAAVSPSAPVSNKANDLKARQDFCKKITVTDGTEDIGALAPVSIRGYCERKCSDDFSSELPLAAGRCERECLFDRCDNPTTLKKESLTENSGSPVAMGSDSSATADPMVACLTLLAAEPRFDEMKKKLPVPDIRNISFEMMANESLPNPKERKAISDWFLGMDVCKDRAAAWRESHYPPEVNALASAIYTKLQLIGVELYKGASTYSSANQRIAVIRDDYTAKLTEVVKKYEQETQAQKLRDAEAKAAEKAQAERRQSYADQQRQQVQDRQNQADYQAQQERLARQQMIVSYLQSRPLLQLPVMQQLPANQMILASPPRSTQTNCHWVGQTWTCTTQ